MATKNTLSKGTVAYDTQSSPTGIIINFNVTYGDDPQPLYEAGYSNIHTIVSMEGMAQVQVSKALFKNDERFEKQGNSVQLLGVPSMTIKNAVLKYSYSASSGQVYVVENLSIIGKKTSATTT